MEHLNDADVARLCHDLPTDPGATEDELRLEAEQAIERGRTRVWWTHTGAPWPSGPLSDG